MDVFGEIMDRVPQNWVLEIKRRTKVMKVTLTTTDGKEIIITEELKETKQVKEVPDFSLDLPEVLAVIQCGEVFIKVSAEELVRAVNAIWSTRTLEM